jgi:hypothetical protein
MPNAAPGQLLGRARRTVHRARRNPFPGARPLLVHCSHHRAGTVWLAQVLDSVAREFGLRRTRLSEAGTPPRRTDLVLFEQGRDYSPDCLHGRERRVSHQVRDPRDVIVSCYHYHLWTEEPWARRPREEYDGRSYQEVLNSLPRDEAIAMEIERLSGEDFLAYVGAKWDGPEVLNLRYEDMIADEEQGFDRLFRHYGFRDSAIARAVEIAAEHSFSAQSGRQVGRVQEKSHLRSGRAGQWQEELSQAHLDLFHERNPRLLDALGYAT